ncbi:MAG: hypothetical protein EOM84_01290 [Sphingobacteriia bacterium]|nr:hypothetical protein [Sphingobacteriia bacterium]
MKTKQIICGLFLSAFLVVPVLTSAQWVGGIDSDGFYGGGLATAQGSKLPDGSISDIVLSVMLWILVLLGFLGVIGFVIAGIIYLTSAGDDNRIGTAKKAMLYSIIGVIVGLMGYVIIKAVDSMLNAGNSF